MGCWEVEIPPENVSVTKVHEMFISEFMTLVYKMLIGNEHSEAEVLVSLL